MLQTKWGRLLIKIVKEAAMRDDKQMKKFG
jgi:hypothetical protein